MKRSRFSEEQIIAILKEQEAGMATADVCRRHGISSGTFYKWKSKYGGLEVSEAWRLRTLETCLPGANRSSSLCLNTDLTTAERCCACRPSCADGSTTCGEAD